MATSTRLSLARCPRWQATTAFRLRGTAERIRLILLLKINCPSSSTEISCFSSRYFGLDPTLRVYKNFENMQLPTEQIVFQSHKSAGGLKPRCAWLGLFSWFKSRIFVYANLAPQKAQNPQKLCFQGVLEMGRHRMMSDQLKYEIARELGVYDTVKQDGWGAVSSRDCGNIVTKAIEMAERQVSEKAE